MERIQRIFWGHMLAAVAALAIGYAVQGLLFVALVFVLLGALWAAVQARSMGGLEGLLLYVFALAAAVGLWIGVPGWAALLALVATLGAWDLDHFLQRLRSVERVAFESGLGREHLRRLALVEGLGYLTGLLALSTRLVISFWWEILLGILLVACIARIIAFVRKQAEE